MIIEAPNWTFDGRWLILNGDGKLWRLAADGSSGLELIDLFDVPDLNNDHVLSPDGRHVFVSANDWHIYEADLDGGPVRRVTNDHAEPAMHFLHGVSPDGGTLAYIGLEPEGEDWWARANIFLIPTAGGADRRLTDESKPFDGCEFTPDGEWIYCNTELFSDVPGHAQIARLRPDGTDLQQLTFDEQVNWFPHISPDGQQILFLSFPPGTTGSSPEPAYRAEAGTRRQLAQSGDAHSDVWRPRDLQCEQLGTRQHAIRLCLLPNRPPNLRTANMRAGYSSSV